MKNVFKKFSSTFLILFSLALWHVISSAQIIPNYLVPAPSEVSKAFFEMHHEFAIAFLSTTKSSIVGLLLSIVIGFSMALFFSFFSVLRSAILPLAVFFQTVPVVAIAPLLVIWFGFGERTVQISAFIVSFFPILANSLVGLASEDPQLSEMFKLFGANKRQIFWRLKIPNCWPFFFSGLKVASGLSVIGSIVGEFVAGGGLGGLIDSARSQQRVDIVFASLILCSSLGLILLFFVKRTSQIMQQKRPYFKSDTLQI